MLCSSRIYTEGYCNIFYHLSINHVVSSNNHVTSCYMFVQLLFHTKLYLVMMCNLKVTYLLGKLYYELILLDKVVI